MITVAICDDEKEQQEQIRSLLKKYLTNVPGQNVHISVFPNGASLLAAAERQRFDIYILDILMPGLNGIETGLRLRQHGSRGEILYLTSSREYAVESYSVRAFFYLVKPVEETLFFQILDRIFKRLKEQKQKCVLVHTKGGILRLSLEQILYAERAGRVMCYHCQNGENIFSLSLRVSFQNASATLLENSCFCLCGASYVLNLSHITQIAGSTVLFDEGIEIYIPHKLSAKLKQSWMTYWLEESNA